MLGEKIVEHMKQFGQRPAIQINDTGDVYTFAQILQRVEYYRQQLILRQLPAGCVAAVSLGERRGIYRRSSGFVAARLYCCPYGRVQCTCTFPGAGEGWAGLSPVRGDAAGRSGPF